MKKNIVVKDPRIREIIRMQKEVLGITTREMFYTGGIRWGSQTLLRNGIIPSRTVMAHWLYVVSIHCTSVEEFYARTGELTDIYIECVRHQLHKFITRDALDNFNLYSR